MDHVVFRLLCGLYLDSTSKNNSSCHRTYNHHTCQCPSYGDVSCRSCVSNLYSRYVKDPGQLWWTFYSIYSSVLSLSFPMSQTLQFLSSLFYCCLHILPELMFLIINTSPFLFFRLPHWQVDRKRVTWSQAATAHARHHPAKASTWSLEETKERERRPG